MPLNPPPLPHNFQSTNKWSLGNNYSNWVNTLLVPYLNTSPLSAPYYIGSTTIFTTVNNKIGISNLSGISSTGNVNMASKYPKPDIPAGTTLYQIAKEQNGKLYRETNVKKVQTDGTYLEKRLGANTTVGFPGSRGALPESLEKTNPTPIQDQNIVSKYRNYTPEAAIKQLAASVILGAASGLSSPRVIQLGSAALDTIDVGPGSLYSTMPFNNIGKIPFTPYQDFRALQGFSDAGDILGKRLDGTALAARNLLLFGGKHTAIPLAYAASSATIGAYSLFNREATYGWGEHGTSYALRNDFTVRSSVSTVWRRNLFRPNKDKQWKRPRIIDDPVAKFTAFRGDKVSVIDFKKSVLAEAYRWDPTDYGKNAKKGFGKSVGAAINKIGTTQDFIKFFFTGPKLTPWDKEAEDDIMTFRAIITSLTDSFNPSWTPVPFIGRADPNYHYGGYNRDINLDFTVYATDRDELKPIWRKLNALASYTAPEYDGSTIGLKGPWMRFTIGDLYYQQPIIINSLYYTLADSESTWEINIEDDPTNMQVPLKIQVSLGATMITDYLPQKGGRMYTLAKTFVDGGPKEGNDNWLSDMESNADVQAKILTRLERKEARLKAKGKDTKEVRLKIDEKNKKLGK